jgi:hypothetical protein
MANTNATRQPNPAQLTDLTDLKGFVDAHWTVPKTSVRQVLDEKAGDEALIDVRDWRSAV